MSLNKIIIPVVLVTLLLGLNYSFKTKETVKWLSWEQALKEKETSNKKVLVKLYTVWCGYCTQMDMTTFKDGKVVSYINENYIPIKFNAESKKDIVVNGVEYKYIAPGTNGNPRGYHELAAALLDGYLQFPSNVVLDNELKVIDVIGGYKNAKDFENYITYFGDDKYLDTPWKSYVENR